jgi:cytidine deaminase
MEKKITVEYEVLDHSDKLTDQEKNLFEIAEKQMELAYAPYSNFYVGAAILLDNGAVIPGSNQENAAYPLCMCAERVALYSAITQYPQGKGVKMAIVANNPHLKVDKPIPPCGSCRQVILEFENRFERPLEILLKDDFGKYYRFKSCSQLLPLAFDGSFLQ